MSDRLIDSAYVRRLFGDKSPSWVNRSKKSGFLPPPTTINGRDYWPQSVIHEKAGIRMPSSEAAVG